MGRPTRQPSRSRATVTTAAGPSPSSWTATGSPGSPSADAHCGQRRFGGFPPIQRSHRAAPAERRRLPAKTWLALAILCRTRPPRSMNRVHDQRLGPSDVVAHPQQDTNVDHGRPPGHVAARQARARTRRVRGRAPEQVLQPRAGPASLSRARAPDHGPVPQITGPRP